MFDQVSSRNTFTLCADQHRVGVERTTLRSTRLSVETQLREPADTAFGRWCHTMEHILIEQALVILVKTCWRISTFRSFNRWGLKPLHEVSILF